MALSQKHPGKILVPWFNNAEWKTAYKLIYSESKEGQRKGIEILKMWKSRVPLLPAGVEGTLIISDALLTNSTCFDQLSDSSKENIKSVYSNALLRFLNLCAASSDRQGSFYREAEKNDIPRWLISYRHEIAHGHNLPSLDMLQTCLIFCFNWLKEKYWEDENFKSEDFVVKTRDIGDVGELSNRQKKKLSKESAKKSRLLKQIQQTHPDILLIERILYDTVCETADDGSKYFPEDILDAWASLLDLIYSQNSIGVLIKKLLEVTKDPLRDDLQRETAAAWLSEIFKGLARLKEIKEYLQTTDQIVVDISDLPPEIETKFPNVIKFTGSTEKQFDEQEVKKIFDEVISDPNEYTLIYLNSMLLLNENEKISKQFMTNVVNYVQAEQNNSHLNEIATVEDLSNFDDIILDVENINISENNTNTIITNTPSMTRRWIKIIDTKPFEGCPLGILPGQYSDKNPSLVF